MFTNIREIADRLKRHPLMDDLPFETILGYTIDFLKIVGTSKSRLEKVGKIKIADYRGELPCDLEHIIQVRDDKDHYYRYSTDSFHFSEDKGQHKGYTYKVQGSCIFTSIKDTELEVAYQAMPVDEEGYPLIKNNYVKALEAYIKMEWFTIQFDLGKIHGQVLANAQQDYYWKVGQAQTEVPSVDEMESITNGWTKLSPSDYDHHRGYANTGSRQIIKKH